MYKNALVESINTNRRVALLLLNSNDIEVEAVENLINSLADTAIAILSPEVVGLLPQSNQEFIEGE